MNENAPEGENNTDNSAASAVAEFKTQLEQLKQENARLQGRFDQVMIDRRPTTAAPVPKQMTPDEYKSLMGTNPAEAVRIAVQDVVQAQVTPLLAQTQAANEKDKWDSKTESDFPAINSDPEFKKLVMQEAREMVESGERTAQDPRLLYRAAQIAIGKTGKKQAPSRGGMTGEAPRSGGGDNSTKFKAPGYFDAFNSVFGVTDQKSKDRLLSKLEKASQPQRRNR